jgi:multidrug efflux pump subunit AcrA (membrane-fusion protein)
MFQARVVRVTSANGQTSVSAVLSGPGHAGSTQYVLEIVTEPLESLSVPNEAIIESDGRHMVYVEAEKGRYVPRQIVPGLQGERYTQVLDGLTKGEQVVTFGSFFIDADHKLKGF